MVGTLIGEKKTSTAESTPKSHGFFTHVTEALVWLTVVISIIVVLVGLYDFGINIGTPQNAAQSNLWLIVTGITGFFSAAFLGMIVEISKKL